VGWFLMARLGPARSGSLRLNGGRSLARKSQQATPSLCSVQKRRLLHGFAGRKGFSRRWAFVKG